MCRAASRGARAALERLRTCGYCRLGPSTGVTAARVHAAYRAAALALTGFYLLQQVVYAVRERRHMDKLARVMFLLLCHLTSIVKQLVFFVDADRIDDLIARLDEPVMSHGQVALSAAARGAERLGRVYSGMAAVTCVLWAVFPVLYFLRGHHVEFPIWTGLIDYNNNTLEFSAVLVYSWYVTSLVGIANTTMDAFFGTVLHQAKTQLNILRCDYENITERVRAVVIQTNEDYDKILKIFFVDCLTRYKKIAELLELLQDIFSGAIVVQFTIGGWILCMAAYQIIGLNVLSIEFASMVLFIFCILTELFIYCYYGNEVTLESQLVAGSVYCARWVPAPAWFRRVLLTALMYAQRPLRPLAGRLLPLSLATFLKILKSSYSFYAVLRQTKT
nr:odorant receptor 31 [Achelura yunnanensis]